MPGEPLSLSTEAPSTIAPAQTEYDAICAAMTATARGRWFLDEFARRNRNADTALVLDALARMQAAVADERGEQTGRAAGQQMRIELLEMAHAIAQARAEAAGLRGEPPAAPAGQAADAAADIAGAAERLRQIAWTMRAVGLDGPAAEQVAQIAEVILSAEALRRLDAQRTQTLGEALLYLEHRIERMLDGPLAAAEPAALAAMGAAGAGADSGVSAAHSLVSGYPEPGETAPGPRLRSDERATAGDPVEADLAPAGVADPGIVVAGIADTDDADTDDADTDIVDAGGVDPGDASTAGNAPADDGGSAELELAPIVVVPAGHIAATPTTGADEIAAAPVAEEVLAEDSAIDAGDGAASAGVVSDSLETVAVDSRFAVQPGSEALAGDAGAAALDSEDDPADFLLEAPAAPSPAADPDHASFELSHSSAHARASGDPQSLDQEQGLAHPQDPADGRSNRNPTEAAPSSASVPRASEAAMPAASAAGGSDLYTEAAPEPTGAGHAVANGPLAALMALSDEERIALFS